jgi:hypothetical protein
MRLEGEGRLWWVPSKRGLFGVKSFYNIMGCHDGFYFSSRSVWRTKVPLRVSFFVWLVALEKILTMNNLRKRCLIMVDWCVMCKMNGKSVDLLLFHCEVVSAIWNVIFDRFGLSWVMFRRVVDLFASW